MVPDAGQELAELFGVPRVDLWLRRRRQLRRVGQVGDVALHAAFPMRVGQSLPKDAVDVADRLHGQAPALAVELPLDEQPGVEVVQVLWRQSLQLNGADPGDDVVEDVAFVGVEGRLAKLGALDR